MRRMIAFAFSALGLITAAFVSIGRAFTELIDAALALIPSEAHADLARLMASPTLALDTPGVPLDAALANSLRHEAGTPRRAAPRNC